MPNHNDEAAVEQAIADKGLTGQRVTPADVDAKIVGEDYHIFPGTTVTVCLLKLENGFSVVGESAAADPANFDEELGRTIARGKARDKIWAFEGYALRERMHKAGE